MHSNKYDPSMEKLKPGTKVGVVGESHIWDGPHGSGSSSGITGMSILKAPTPYKAGPITMKAQGKV
jgi:hypothetical protein